METPESELSEIADLTALWESGMFPMDVVAYKVCECIVKYSDASLINCVHVDISNLIMEMISSYRKNERIISSSNLGEFDMTEFISKVDLILGGSGFTHQAPPTATR